MKKLLIATTIALLSAGAQADQLYGEVGYGYMTFKAADEDASPNILRGIIGFQFHPNVAVEGMLGLGVRNATISGSSVFSDAKFKVSNALGIYLKPNVLLGENTELYGRIGHTRIKNKFSESGYESESTTNTFFGAGVGVKYTFSNNAYLGADYMYYGKKDDVKASGLTLSVGFRF